jgi:hypothetical protein
MMTVIVKLDDEEVLQLMEGNEAANTMTTTRSDLNINFGKLCFWYKIIYRRISSKTFATLVRV